MPLALEAYVTPRLTAGLTELAGGRPTRAGSRAGSRVTARARVPTCGDVSCGAPRVWHTGPCQCAGLARRDSGWHTVTVTLAATVTDSDASSVLVRRLACTAQLPRRAAAPARHLGWIGVEEYIVDCSRPDNRRGPGGLPTAIIYYFNSGLSAKFKLPPVSYFLAAWGKTGAFPRVKI